MQPNANNNMMNNAPQTTPMNPGGDIVFKDKPKKNKGMVAGLIILALLATGGIAFGVWAYLDGNQKTTNLNNQISDLKSQLANQPEIDETVIDVDTDSNINTADFFYIGEWGIKIKIDDLEIIGTRVSFDNDNDMDTIHVAVSSQSQYRDAGNNYFSNTAYPENIIARSKQPTIKPFAFMGIQDDLNPVYNDGEYNYFTYKPTGYALEGLADPGVATETYNKMTELLNNSDNYSKI